MRDKELYKAPFCLSMQTFVYAASLVVGTVTPHLIKPKRFCCTLCCVPQTNCGTLGENPEVVSYRWIRGVYTSIANFPVFTGFEPEGRNPFSRETIYIRSLQRMKPGF